MQEVLDRAMTAIAIQRKPEILERLANGEFVTKIAESMGVERSTLSQILRNDPEYVAAREAGVEIRLDQGLEKLEEAGDDINLARAREIALRRLEWRAEREFPARWGQKTETKVDATLKVEVVRFGAEAVQQSNASVTSAEPKLIGSSTCDLT
jgi:transcriptional regulator with XRE-family HTH domain